MGFSYPNYDCDKIRNIIIDKGNDATHRIWLCKLCEENTYSKLIVECIAVMKNNAEMVKAISTLIIIGKHDTIYCRMLENVITNDRYRSQVIEMYLESGLDRYICAVFSKMTNNKYIFDVLKMIFRTKEELFDNVTPKKNLRLYSLEFTTDLYLMNNWNPDSTYQMKGTFDETRNAVIFRYDGATAKTDKDEMW